MADRTRRNNAGQHPNKHRQEFDAAKAQTLASARPAKAKAGIATRKVAKGKCGCSSVL